MKFHPQYSLWPALLLACATLHAEPTSCPSNLKWSDASYYARTTYLPGKKVEASVQYYSDAVVATLESDGVHGSAISLEGAAYPAEINLTRSAGKLVPLDFAEIGMAVAPPMMEAPDLWPTLGSPCALPESETVEISESSATLSEKGVRLRGSIRRTGATIRYTLNASDTQGSESSAETMTGVWSYSPSLDQYPENADMGGWQVFRGNEYLMTIPADRHVALKSLATLIANVLTGKPAAAVVR